MERREEENAENDNSKEGKKRECVKRGRRSGVEWMGEERRREVIWKREEYVCDNVTPLTLLNPTTNIHSPSLKRTHRRQTECARRMETVASSCLSVSLSLIQGRAAEVHTEVTRTVRVRDITKANLKVISNLYNITIMFKLQLLYKVKLC